jgi:membrane protein involved in colicin uptake
MQQLLQCALAGDEAAAQLLDAIAGSSNGCRWLLHYAADMVMTVEIAAADRKLQQRRPLLDAQNEQQQQQQQQRRQRQRLQLQRECVMWALQLLCQSAQHDRQAVAASGLSQPLSALVKLVIGDVAQDAAAAADTAGAADAAVLPDAAAAGADAAVDVDVDAAAAAGADADVDVDAAAAAAGADPDVDVDAAAAAAGADADLIACTAAAESAACELSDPLMHCNCADDYLQLLLPCYWQQQGDNGAQSADYDATQQQHSAYANAVLLRMSNPQRQ